MVKITEKQKELIKATVPLLETGGETLTKHFYKIMLGEFTEVRALFNMAHQASGDQPRALANSILRYARNIDAMEKLGPLVSQIINKHVSLQVLPEHYPIVGTCLLRAIKEVLGEEVATDEVIEAWRVAYQQLADILIAKEEQIYQSLETRPGGWRGGRMFNVVKKEQESEEIVSFYFEPSDGKQVLEYEPGQYTGLRVIIDGEEFRRNYSLSDSPNTKYYRISVKREPKGKVSNYLHDHVHVGDQMELFPPAGDFVLRESNKPLVFITAGVGITPSISMLEKSVKTDRNITYIHCARNGGVHAFKDWLENITNENKNIKRYYVYNEPREDDRNVHKGFLTMDLLKEWLPQERNIDVYFLGPKPFMAFMKKYMRELGVPDEQVFYEFFGPGLLIKRSIVMF